MRAEGAKNIIHISINLEDLHIHTSHIFMKLMGHDDGKRVLR